MSASMIMKLLQDNSATAERTKLIKTVKKPQHLDLAGYIVINVPCFDE